MCAIQMDGLLQHLYFKQLYRSKTAVRIPEISNESLSLKLWDTKMADTANASHPTHHVCSHQSVYSQQYLSVVRPMKPKPTSTSD